MNKKMRAEIEGLEVEKENCVCTVELELSGLVNWLRSQFPGAPDRLLWAVAKYEPSVREKVRMNRREAARIQRKIAALKRRGKSGGARLKARRLQK